MDRTVRITISITNIDGDTPSGEDIVNQLREDFNEIRNERQTVTVTLDTEYDE